MGRALQLLLTAGTAGAASKFLSPGVFSCLSIEGHPGTTCEFPGGGNPAAQGSEVVTKITLLFFEVVHSGQG